MQPASKITGSLKRNHAGLQFVYKYESCFFSSITKECFSRSAIQDREF